MSPFIVSRMSLLLHKRPYERARPGLEAARARGKKPFNPFDQKVLAAQKMHQDHSINVLDICHALNISRATLYRYLKAKQGVTL